MSLKDQNRFRKIYPFIRRKPYNIPEGDVIYDVQTVSVPGTDEVTVNFATTFSQAPIVTATAYDSKSNSQANVNVYVISVSTSQAVLGFSAAFTGEVQVHAIQGA